MSGSKVSDEGAIVQRRVFPLLGLASKGGHRPGARSSLHCGTLSTSRLNGSFQTTHAVRRARCTVGLLVRELRAAGAHYGRNVRNTMPGEWLHSFGYLPGRDFVRPRTRVTWSGSLA